MKSFVNSRFVALLLSTLLLVAPAFSTAALSPASRAILDEAAESVDQEKESLAALEALKKRPRSEVLKALRDGIANGQPWIIVSARAALALEAKELLPDLMKAAEKEDAWQVFSAIEQLSRDSSERPAVEALFTRKLAKAPSSSKVAILDAFSNGKTQLPKSSFDALIKDESLGVRRAVVRQFLASREAYSNDEQIRRFKLAFTMKPYQARLDALLMYGAIPAAKRRSIASAFDPGLCAKEANASVKSACETIAKEAK
ncbi:MAG: SseB family protein [Bdellovibrionota bacterium]